MTTTVDSTPGEAARASAARESTRRPIGLSILAFAAAVTGVALLLWSGAWFGASDIVAGTRLAAIARVIGLALAGVAVMELLLAYGIWELRPWALPLGIAATITALVLTLLSAGRGSDGAHSFSLLLEIGTLWYLLSPRVREALAGNRGAAR